MYAIIYWKHGINPHHDKNVFFVKNENGSIWIANKLEQADERANKIEELLGIEDFCRVVNLDAEIMG